MDALFIQYNSMLQNKIYHNFLIEIFKTFLIILFGLSLIALTVRAVSFLDLIVDNGYPAEKVVMGMMSGDFTSANFSKALDEVSKIKGIINSLPLRRL